MNLANNAVDAALLPLKLDFTDEYGAAEEAPIFAEPNFDDMGQMTLNPTGPNVADYPSLRDLETSNVFSGVNHHFNI